ncbi:HIT family protein [Streptomyces sp. NPDC002870]|uniref:HIT family protein n=1 Tax=Streptomyces sp. NPDC002870 TaxID=3364666 RepID=UPI00368BD497
MTSTNLAEFRAKFRLDELTIHSTEHWTWSVRPVHSTLGSGILSLNRYADSFAAITPEEGADLTAMTRHIESKLKSVFGPQKMNYIMLMMVDSHLHFHVLPRYATEQQFAGLGWSDSGWPTPPALTDNADRADSPALVEVRDALK